MHSVDHTGVLLTIRSLTLKYMSQETETGTLSPMSTTDLSLSNVQIVYDLNGRSLLGDAKALPFITSRYVYLENLQQGALAWEYMNKTDSQLVSSS